MTAPTLTIGGNDQLEFVHDRTMSVKLQQFDVTLIDPIWFPENGQTVELTNPTWSGTVTSTEATTYGSSLGNRTYWKVTATNTAVLPDLGAAPFELSDTPDNATSYGYSDLVVTRTFNEGVTEIRAKCRVIREGLAAGHEVTIQALPQLWEPETLTIRDLTTTWPVADGPVYELDLGFGDFEESSTGGGGGTPLDPPTFNTYVTKVIHQSTTNVIRNITDTFDRPSSVTPGTSDSGILWVVSSGNAGISSNRLEVASGGDANLTYGPLGLPFSARFDLQSGGSMDDALIVVGNVSIDFEIDTGDTYDVFVDVIGPGSGVDSFSQTITPGVWYSVRVEQVAGVTGRVKIWPRLDSEPGTWDAEATNATGNSTPDFAGFAQLTAPNSFYIDNLDISGLGQFSGVPRLLRKPFSWNTASISTGVAIATLAAGDVVLGAWIDVATAWNSTVSDLGDIVTATNSESLLAATVNMASVGSGTDRRALKNGTVPTGNAALMRGAFAVNVKVTSVGINLSAGAATAFLLVARA